jgi:hypothetical protein
LEQRRPDLLLSFGRRNQSIWASGYRGTALLLLNRKNEAENEFAALRASIAPLLGDHVAGPVIEFHRMQAAFYSGDFERVLRIWPQLPPSFWSLYALEVGRAYAHQHVFAEAGHFLQLASQAQLAFFMNEDMSSQSNHLAWLLAQFYQGQVLEKSGRRPDALARYKRFVQGFGPASAPLPEVALARSALARVQFSERGKLLFEDEFSGTALAPGWTGTPGDWRVAEGSLTLSETPGRETTERLRPLRFHDAVFEFTFRANPVSWINFTLQTVSGDLCRLALGRGNMHTLVTKPLSSQHFSKVEMLDESNMTAEAGQWHQAVVEVRGRRIVARVDDRFIITGESARIDVDKTSFALGIDGGVASFDGIKVYGVARTN